MSPSVQAVTLQSGRTFDEVFRDRVSGPKMDDLDEELTKILSREDKDRCPRKCTTGHSQAGGGGGLGRGAAWLPDNRSPQLCLVLLVVTVPVVALPEATPIVTLTRPMILM